MQMNALFTALMTNLSDKNVHKGLNINLKSFLHRNLSMILKRCFKNTKAV